MGANKPMWLEREMSEAANDEPIMDLERSATAPQIATTRFSQEFLAKVAGVLRRNIVYFQVSPLTDLSSSLLYPQQLDSEFAGDSAVTFLFTKGFVSSREEGAALGQELINHRFIHHAIQPNHPFSDSSHTYCFYLDSDPPITSVNNLPVAFPKLSISTNEIEMLVRAMRNEVAVKDRFWGFRTFENCFVGSQAVSWLVQSAWATSREDAVMIGRWLLNMGHFHHVCRQHQFKDGKFFYRWTEIQASWPEHILLNDLISQMVQGIPCKPRRWRLWTFDACFLGRELIDFLVNNNHCPNRSSALALAKHLQNIGVFSHVSHDHVIKDSDYYYRWNKTKVHSLLTPREHQTRGAGVSNIPIETAPRSRAMVSPAQSYDTQFNSDLVVSPASLREAHAACSTEDSDCGLDSEFDAVSLE
eukprot:c26523_g1_i1.p1 GENE.c26523_g1_i1~~c26523_g1_i1.p1  ORF type:complete len:416 (-),score=85.17 c26523_g1_i1:70-1317(-)